jgi:hypothetical protein
METPAASPDRPVVITARRLRGTTWAATAAVADDLSLLAFGTEQNDATASAFARVLDYLDVIGAPELPELEFVVR